MPHETMWERHQCRQEAEDRSEGKAEAQPLSVFAQERKGKAGCIA